MEPLSATEILARTGSKVFARGQDYFESGAITSLAKRGQSLHAKVEGSDYEPYRVAIHWGEVGADCSCPFADEWGDWCKHIVAVLLAFTSNQARLKEQPPLGDLLEPLDRVQLVELLVELNGRNPALYEEVVAVLTGEEPDEDDERD